MAKRPTAKESPRRTWWDVLNSNIVVAFFSLVIVGGVAAIYSERQSALADQEARREVLGKHLAEYQHRIGELGSADSRLNYQLGPSGTFDRGRRLDQADRAAVRSWERLTEEVSCQEWDILMGRGRYVPTSPEYNGVSLVNLGTQIDNVAGIQDLQFGPIRMIGLLETPPTATWIFLRSQLPMLMRAGVGRNLLYINRTLPLRRGVQLTNVQERQLGIPQPQPGELERLEQENDAHFNSVINELGDEDSQAGSMAAPDCPR